MIRIFFNERNGSMKVYCKVRVRNLFGSNYLFKIFTDLIIGVLTKTANIKKA